MRQVWECFGAHATVGQGVLLGPNAWCVNAGDPSHIRLGANSVCRGVLRCDKSTRARIEVGEDVYLGDDVLISAMEEIIIERAVMVAHGVQILDNDSHPTDPDERFAHWRRIRHGVKTPVRVASSPIQIREYAWIGLNSLIMKGVTVGEAAIVAAGAVVTRDVPPWTLVAGNPARVVRELEQGSAARDSARRVQTDMVHERDVPVPSSQHA